MAVARQKRVYYSWLPGLTLCLNLMPFIPAITLTLIARRACPAATKERQWKARGLERGLALSIPL